MAPVCHVVLFPLVPAATEEQCRELNRRLLALQTECTVGKPERQLIKSVIGGTDMSIEGRQGGITHAYVMHFDSEADRDTYVKDSGPHTKFVADMVGAGILDVEKIRVVDFNPGVFDHARNAQKL